LSQLQICERRQAGERLAGAAWVSFSKSEAGRVLHSEKLTFYRFCGESLREALPQFDEVFSGQLFHQVF
jgi:hypothetical protein